jgi:hypothetical protein
MPNPLGEVFGFPIDNNSEAARNYRDNKLCPFHNIVPKCTKVSEINPLGVCSMNSKDGVFITCPVRFRENWFITTDAGKFFFPDNEFVTAIPEIKVTDKNGEAVGNVDYILVAHDKYGRVLDFAPLEVQAVYITGNITGPFEYFMSTRDSNLDWPRNRNYPKPDWLSSSMKRLVPQLLAKGSIMRQWGKKQAIAVQKDFLDRMPKSVPVVPKEQADVVWLLYDLIDDPATNTRKLTRLEPVYSSFQQMLERFTTYEAGPVEMFTSMLQGKLEAVNRGKFAIDADDIVVDE